MEQTGVDGSRSETKEKQRTACVQAEQIVIKWTETELSEIDCGVYGGEYNRISEHNRME